MKPLAGYTRVSHVGDRPELRSPELQQERISSFAKFRGLRVEMVEPELDVSGGKVERPVLESVIDGIRDGRYGGIVVSQLDRLSRMNLADALYTIERIEAITGPGGVIAVAENFDVSTPEGEGARSMFLVNANMQLKRFARQFSDAKQRALAEGIWLSPKVPFGYRKPGKGKALKLGPPAEVAKVRLAFEMRVEGKSWTAIAKALGFAHHTRVVDLVRNPVYLGELHLKPFEPNRKAHPPIVDRNTWEAAQLQQPRSPRGKYPPALVSGIVRCTGCQRAMGVAGNLTRGRHYVCRTMNRAGLERCPAPSAIRVDLLDEYVEQIALAHLDAMSAEATERQQTVRAAEKELRAAERELANFSQAVSAAGMGVDQLAAALRVRQEAVDDAREGVARARIAAGPLPTKETLVKAWPRMTVEARRQVLRGALGVVWVNKGRAPVADRVRLVAAGFEPAGLSRPGVVAPVAPLKLVDNLPGEVRVASA